MYLGEKVESYFESMNKWLSEFLFVIFYFNVFEMNVFFYSLLFFCESEILVLFCVDSFNVFKGDKILFSGVLGLGKMLFLEVLGG